MTAKKRRIKVALTIGGVIIALIWLSPFYLMIVNAFKSKYDIFANVLSLPEAWVFDNFKQAFIDLDFINALANSAFVSIFSILLIIIFSSMAAYALARNKSKISGAIFLVFVAAMLIPFQSVMIPLISIFGKMNLLNTYGLLFMYLGFGSSLSLFLYHGAIKGIPTSLDEAAMIDGASRWKIFWRIIFPMLKPITVTVLILNVIWIWNDYLLPSLVLSQEYATIPLRMFFFFGQYTRQWHLALAGLTLAIIPVITLYFFAQKHIIKGVAEGAVK
ncbi:carbohydrate ABC transporter permease [Amphibacillus sp. Q70]|uniref:carbohydrate ABC transporter permease n=1 Tax=Amphibacillus sp. Q70 TaxID=3453416 RepID=UPI003F845F71